MKKFVLLYVGFDPLWANPSDPRAQETRQAWGTWFASVGDRFVDSGSPFGSGKEVTSTGTKDLPPDRNAIVGYSILKAENLKEAEAIAKSCPMITSVRVYEAMAM